MHRLAIKMLMGDTGKYFAMIIGVMFATLIMTQQPAIFLGLLTRTYAHVENITQNDLWVMDPSVQYVEENMPLPDYALPAVRGVTGVRWAVPLYKNFAQVRLPDGRKRSVDLTGIDSATLIGAPPVMLEGHVTDLRRPDAVVVDHEAAKRFASRQADDSLRPLRMGDVMELNERRAVVVGIAKSLPTFTTAPLIYTTFDKALGYVPQERRTDSYLLVKLQPGADMAAVKKAIAARTGLLALDREAFKAANITYWMTNTGIPINFGTAVVLGFLVGLAVAGQTFYSFVRDNIRYFAALKAMGVQHRALMQMVLIQALVVGGQGFGLGVGLSAAFGYSLEGSALAFYMPWQLLVFSAAGTGFIITVAALMGLAQIRKVDPAIVFK